MIEFTDEERRIITQYNPYFLDNPFEVVEEGLISSYGRTDENTEFKDVIYEYTKRFLMEIAKKRNIKIDEKASFDIEDMLQEADLYGIEDFDIQLYKDYDLLKQYIDEKVKDMNSDQLEDLYYAFFGMGGIQSNFTNFMVNHVLKINYNMSELSEELDKDNSEEKEVNGSEADVIEINNDNKTEDAEDIEWETFDFDDDFWDDGEMDDFGTNLKSDDNHLIQGLSDEELVECIKFLNTWEQLKEYKRNGEKISSYLSELKKSKKLDEFFEDKEFMEEFEKIMSHDKKEHLYLFHGTQSLEDAESILKQGLGMMRDDLSTTSYQEFSMEDVILYSRGMGGVIGKDAIVIIDNPINEDGTAQNIIERLDENADINFLPSGLQGLNGRPQYIVPTQYIVGFVNKRDKKIVFNPRYHAHDKSKGDFSILPKDLIGVSDVVEEAEHEIRTDFQNREQEERI